MTDITINQGTTYTMAYTYTVNGSAGNLTGATIRFTVKDAEYDTSSDDSTALIKKNVTSHSDPTAGISSIDLAPVDTDVTPGKYFYDIKVEDSAGNIYKTHEGRLTIDGSPTNRRV